VIKSEEFMSQVNNRTHNQQANRKGRPSCLAWTGTVLTLMLTAVFSLTTLHHSRKLEQTQLLQSVSNELLLQLAVCRHNESELLSHPLTSSEAIDEQIQVQTQKTAEAFQKLAQTIDLLSKMTPQVSEKTLARLQQITQQSIEKLSAVQAGNHQYQSMNEFDPAVSQLVQEINSTSAQANTRFKHALTLSIGFGVISSILGYLVMLKFIVRPLQEVTHAANVLAHGDVGFKLKHESNTEIGQLADAIRKTNLVVHKLEGELKRFAKALQKGQLDYRADQTQFSGFYQNILKKLNQTAGSIEAPLNQVEQFFADANKAELTAGVPGKYPGRFQDLKKSINKSLQNLNKLAEHNSQVGGAATELHCAEDEDAAVTNLQEALAALQQSAIEQTSKVRTIDDTTLQTILQALNAAVDAANGDKAIHSEKTKTGQVEKSQLFSGNPST